MIIDSHCHLNYLPDAEGALLRARSEGVSGFLCIGVDAAGMPAVQALSEQHADVWATTGQHPDTDAGIPYWMTAYVGHARVVALGEMGLDYYRHNDAATIKRQQENFVWQMAMAQANGLPVVIHTREAEADTLAILRDFPDVKGVLHCFTGSPDMAEAALALGYYVSFSGIVTFKAADNVRDALAVVPDTRLLVETDAPWLAPVPVRGKPCEPAFVRHTLGFVAQQRNMDLETAAMLTRENFFRLFARAQCAH